MPKRTKSDILYLEIGRREVVGVEKDDVTLIRNNIDKVLSEVQDTKILKMIYEFIRGIKGN